ncbi:MAG: urease accessory UreF family protein [Xanthobacteraceae bacterium]|nr:urease accessory UreF family protein [Xanthobacteraceae bacterium]
MMSILQAMWQADGSFPNGSFAFSYGLEGFVVLRGKLDATDLSELMSTIIRQRWATFDRVALLRAFRAKGDPALIGAVDREVEAATFGEALRSGSRRNGASFLNAHARLGSPIAAALRSDIRTGTCLGHMAVMQGAVWQETGLDERLAQLASGYAVASGLVTTAVRLGVVGALQGQGLLRACLPEIARLAAIDSPENEELSSFLPVLEIASARHAKADLRLFAN